jgi:hypothetical protein
MRDATAQGKQGPVAVPLRSPGGRDEEPQSAWVSEEAVPLRVAAERVEAEERADRLRLVNGRRRARRR